jgi:hypothetical protein
MQLIHSAGLLAGCVAGVCVLWKKKGKEKKKDVPEEKLCTNFGNTLPGERVKNA